MTVIIILIFAIILAIPFALAFIKKNFDPFEPIYLWCILFGFLYLVKPAIQLIRGTSFRYGGNFLNEALIIAITGLLAFYLGYYSKIGKKIASWIPVIKSEISSKKLQIIAWIFIALGFLGLNQYIQISGGWQAFWSRPHGIAGQAHKTTAYLYQLPELMVIGFLLMCETIIHRKITERKKTGAKGILTLIAAGLGGVGIYTIIWGSRTLYSWLIIAIIAIYFLKKRARPKLKATIGIIVLLYVVLSLVPVYRSFMYLGSSFEKFAKNFNPIRDLASPLQSDGDEFHVYLAEVALVPESIGYDYFNLYGRFFLHPIPRLIWPDKPAFLNSKWDEFLAKSGLGWGSAETMLGDFYAQLGILAVILGTFLSGIFWKTIYEYLRQNPTNRSVIIIYAVILPNMFTYLAQSAVIAFLKWLPYMAPATIIALFLAREKKSPNS